MFYFAKKTNVLNRLQRHFYLPIVFLFLLLYFQVFFADYAYLDEINQLWLNRDSSNFILFHTQGRWLTGLLFQKFFSSVSQIEQIKLFRIFSLTGWIATSVLWAHLCRGWLAALKLDFRLWYISIVYFIASLPVVIYIGWASCMEVFIGIAAALLSGHVLFSNLLRQEKEIHVSNKAIFLSLFFGLISLFTYQTTFGAFLLPFFLYLLKRNKPLIDRKMVIGICFYIVTYGLYYFLFKYSLKVYDLQASTRTEINANFLSKLSFFFAGPIPEGFSLNLIYTSRSVFSQVFYILVIVVWLVSVFKNTDHKNTRANIGFIAAFFFLLALVYIPLFITSENFASTRTLFVFNLFVLLIVAHSLLQFLRTQKMQNGLAWTLCGWIILTGWFAYNLQFVGPLKKEYKAVREHFQASYQPAIRHVDFIRAERTLFQKQYGSLLAKDEFGSPSTHKDWVPEPLARQLVLEITGNRKTAETLTVHQYENSLIFDSTTTNVGNSFLIDPNTLLLK